MSKSRAISSSILLLSLTAASVLVASANEQPGAVGTPAKLPHVANETPNGPAIATPPAVENRPTTSAPSVAPISGLLAHSEPDEAIKVALTRGTGEPAKQAAPADLLPNLTNYLRPICLSLEHIDDKRLAKVQAQFRHFVGLTNNKISLCFMQHYLIDPAVKPINKAEVHTICNSKDMPVEQKGSYRAFSKCASDNWSVEVDRELARIVATRESEPAERANYVAQLDRDQMFEEAVSRAIAEDRAQDPSLADLLPNAASPAANVAAVLPALQVVSTAKPMEHSSSAPPSVQPTLPAATSTGKPGEHSSDGAPIAALVPAAPVSTARPADHSSVAPASGPLFPALVSSVKLVEHSNSTATIVPFVPVAAAAAAAAVAPALATGSTVKPTGDHHSTSGPSPVDISTLRPHVQTSTSSPGQANVNASNTTSARPSETGSTLQPATHLPAAVQSAASTPKPAQWTVPTSPQIDLAGVKASNVTSAQGGPAPTRAADKQVGPAVGQPSLAAASPGTNMSSPTMSNKTTAAPTSVRPSSIPVSSRIPSASPVGPTLAPTTTPTPAPKATSPAGSVGPATSGAPLGLAPSSAGPAAPTTTGAPKQPAVPATSGSPTRAATSSEPPEQEEEEQESAGQQAGSLQTSSTGKPALAVIGQVLRKQDEQMKGFAQQQRDERDKVLAELRRKQKAASDKAMHQLEHDRQMAVDPVGHAAKHQQYEARRRQIG